MKRRIFISIIILATLLISCEKDKSVTDTVTFEELPLGSSGFWNGSDLTGGFTSGNIRFKSRYDTQYGTWSGFAYSSITDTIIKDFSNQYSVIAKGGAEGSEKYCVSYSSGLADTMFFTVPEKVTGIYLSNTVYTYHTIKNGNQFSKKFGGVTGLDPDWFKLTITALDARGTVIGTGYIFLADFTFPDNTQDYIVDRWEKIDLSVFGYVSALKFELSSSDIGQYGMNTPAYFCIDNITGVLASQ